MAVCIIFQQPPQEDPNLMIAQAELQKAQAEQLNAQVKQSQAELDAQVKIEQAKIEQQKVDLERQRLDLDAQKFIKGQDDKFNVDAATIQQGQQKIDLQSQKQIHEMALKLTELEAKIGQDLSSQNKENMVDFVFDPATGELNAAR